MRAKVWAGAVIVALALAGCAAIPHEGPVEYGNLEVDPSQPLFPFAEGPNPGDSPTTMVRNFLAASAAGVTSDFSVAKEYLTEQASADWNPTARVVVSDAGSLTADYDAEQGVIRYQVPVAAVLDSSGRLIEGTGDEREPLEFTVVEDNNGQWRISGLDEGVVIPEAYLTRYLRPVELVFASQDGSVVVPEVRWLPNNNIATLAARELIEGPSPWLADAMTTGFPAGAGLEVESVVVTEGVATVPLTAESAGGPEDRALAAEQLRLTLTALPNVTEVVVTVGGLPIEGAGEASLTRAPTPDQNALAVVGDRLGMWDGSELTMVPAALGRVPGDASGFARSYRADAVSFLIGRSQLAVAPDITAGSEVLVPADSEADTPDAVMDFEVIYEGRSLVDPSFDRHGWVWSAERSSPERLLAFNGEGERVDPEARVLAERSLQALAVSRDGARIAMLTRDGPRQVVEVAGVVRTDDGTPLSITDTLNVGVGVTAAHEVVWLDDTTIAVLGEQSGDNAPSVWIISVGGRTEMIEAVSGVSSATARYGERSLYVVSDEGDVRERVGTGWSAIASGVRELTYAG
jgi:hypothetical protein